MATPAENIAAAIQTVSAKIVAVLADPLPNITVDGVTIDRQAYYRQLLDTQKALIEQAQLVAGPFTQTSVAR